MAFIREVKSKKGVAVKFWRIASFTFSRSGDLTVSVDGFIDGEAYAGGADPADEYTVIFHNAGTGIKAPFYNMVESGAAIFEGAQKELAWSAGQPAGPQAVTVQTPRGDLIGRKTIETPAAAQPAMGQPEAPAGPHAPEPPRKRGKPARAAAAPAALPAAQAGDVPVETPEETETPEEAEAGTPASAR